MTRDINGCLSVCYTYWFAQGVITSFNATFDFIGTCVCYCWNENKFPNRSVKQGRSQIPLMTFWLPHLTPHWILKLFWGFPVRHFLPDGIVKHVHFYYSKHIHAVCRYGIILPALEQEHAFVNWLQLTFVSLKSYENNHGWCFRVLIYIVHTYWKHTNMDE